VGPDRKRPRRCLLVLARDTIGGTEIGTSLVAEWLNAAGVHTEVAILEPPGAIAAGLRERGVPAWSLGDGRGGLAGAALRLGRLIRSGGFDLVNAFGFKASVLARVLTRGLAPGTIFVCGVQGLHVTEVVELDEPKGRFALLVERLTQGLVHAYDCNSHGAVELLAAHGVKRSKLHYVPNGVDLSQWPQRAEPAAGGVPTILCVARFVERKRQPDLLRALLLLDERGFQCRVEFAGDGPTLESARQLASELGVEGRVSFLGPLSPAELAASLESAAALCLPSLWEGTPGAVLEAMARGVPVVGTDVNGTRDLIQDGITGLLVPPRTPEALADALGEVLADPAAAAKRARAARELVEREHSIDAMAGQKLELFERLLAAVR
jgi:glycosyltransferase involved in cell wall biosynthesis